MGVRTLTPVIKIDEEKCINCYACITACPVKYCMNGAGDKLDINHNLCIGCGNCISACTHNARLPLDDTARFMEDIKRGDKMIAIVAPAIAAFFPEKYLNLNGFLKSLGVEAVFDVSFGAELTVYSYIEHIKNNKPRTVIASPCPAIVTYVEIYKPKLLPYLAPTHGPMLDEISMIKEYYPQYKNYKIAVISPCIAKRREFDETGLGQYNVTMLALKKYLEEQGKDISSFPKVDYEGPVAERAVRFSIPGGLLDTAERFVPGIRRQTQKSEGLHVIYPYLEEMAELVDTNDELPLLIDCLSCEKGCNGGPGTGNIKVPTNKLESPINKRSEKLEAYHNPKKAERLYKRYNNFLGKYWKKGLYDRHFFDLSGNDTIVVPNESQLKEVFEKMRKFSKKDIYNCTACGYFSCKSMATAIYNNLNKPENCLHFNFSILADEQKEINIINDDLHKCITDAISIISGINDSIKALDARMDGYLNHVSDSSEITEQMADSLKSTSERSKQKEDVIGQLIEDTEKGQESMKQMIQSVHDISQFMDGISSAMKIISGIAANTNLLAMNAAIEAAHAGESGKGFAVVAEEIRKLSESTKQNSQNITSTLSSIIKGIDVSTKHSGETESLISKMSLKIHDLADTIHEMVSILGNVAQSSNGVTGNLKSIREQSSEVKSEYAAMLEKISDLLTDMKELSKKMDKEKKAADALAAQMHG